MRECQEGLSDYKILILLQHKSESTVTKVLLGLKNGRTWCWGDNTSFSQTCVVCRTQVTCLHIALMPFCQKNTVPDVLLKPNRTPTWPADGMLLAGVPKHLYSPLSSTLILKYQSNDQKITIKFYNSISRLFAHLFFPIETHISMFPGRWRILTDFLLIPLWGISPNWGRDASKSSKDVIFPFVFLLVVFLLVLFSLNLGHLWI